MSNILQTYRTRWLRANCVLQRQEIKREFYNLKTKIDEDVLDVMWSAITRSDKYYEDEEESKES